MAKTISIPIKELAEGTRKVAEGDLSFTIPLVSDDEIGSLVDSFNKMTKDLRLGREQIELSSKKMQEQNTELEARRQYMVIVLKNISAGVISLDAEGLITTVNKAAERMLNIKAEDVVYKNFKKLLKGDLLKLAEETVDQLLHSKAGFTEFPLRLTINNASKSFMMHLNVLKEDIGNQIGIVMVFDDLTELEKAQRMLAWREVARRIAHEVKNPLTPIKLSAQRIRRKYNEQINEPIFNECTQTIIDHVDLIKNIVNEFSAFARFPTANPKRCDLPTIIEETVALYREGHRSIEFKIIINENIPLLQLDRQQMKQAMINLVDNAIESIKKQGTIEITISYDPILKMVRLEIADTGCGISDQDKTRLFEPYFSKKTAGMGLGLTIVSTIVKDNHGTISAKDNKDNKDNKGKGTKFIIEFPEIA